MPQPVRAPQTEPAEGGARQAAGRANQRVPTPCPVAAPKNC
jgi:hypothetical protein